MADKKLSALTDLAATPATNDVLLILDTSAGASKKVTYTNLLAGTSLGAGGTVPYINAGGGSGLLLHANSTGAGIDNLFIGSDAPSLVPGNGLGQAHGNVALGCGWIAGQEPPEAQHGNLGALTTGYDNTAVGAGSQINSSTGSGNASLGPDSLRKLTTGSFNVAIGPQALEFITTANNLIAIGQGTLQNYTATDPGLAIGVGSLQAATSGGFNLGVGFHTLNALTTGTGNLGIGYQAGSTLNGNNNVGIGVNALQVATTPDGNAAVGYTVLNQTTTGGFNAALGYRAGFSNTTGAGNTFIGQKAGDTDGTNASSGTITNATLIGERAQSKLSEVIVLGKATATRPNLSFGGTPIGAGFFGNGVGVFFIANAATDPNANPTGGGLLYVSGGALKYRGSSGTITTLGAA